MRRLVGKRVLLRLLLLRLSAGICSAGCAAAFDAAAATVEPAVAVGPSFLLQLEVMFSLLMGLLRL